MSTIQYDFNQPRGFELEYQADDGTRKRPVMIHSAKFGSIERFIGVLTEHYAGAFPAWLAPVQERYADLRADDNRLEDVLEAGADKARAIASGTVADVRAAMGVGPARRPSLR